MNWLNLSIVAAVIIALTAAVIFVLWQAERPQVYLYNNSSNAATSGSAAENIAVGLNGALATPAQVQASYNAGASWCVMGWASDGNTYYPFSAPSTSGCVHGLNKGTCADYGGACGVLVYGKKPPQGTSNITAFNGSEQWSQWKWYSPFH